MNSPESPSSLLERAATLLGNLASGATPGPWRRHDTHLNTGGHTATVLNANPGEPFLLAWLPTFSNQPWSAERNVWNNSAWMATMSPAVAAPLMAWLRDSARSVREHDEDEVANGTKGRYCPNEDQALEFARTILGEPS